MSVSFDHPFWACGGNPKKEDFFTGDSTTMEDFLQHNAAFINGFGTEKRICHSDSYGTIVDFEALEKAIKLVDETLKPSDDEWMSHVEYWLGNPNNQPPLRMVGFFIARLHNIDVTRFERKKP